MVLPPAPQQNKTVCEKTLTAHLAKQPPEEIFFGSLIMVILPVSAPGETFDQDHFQLSSESKNFAKNFGEILGLRWKLEMILVKFWQQVDLKKTKTSMDASPPSAPTKEHDVRKDPYCPSGEAASGGIVFFGVLNHGNSTCFHSGGDIWPGSFPTFHTVYHNICVNMRAMHAYTRI